MPIVTRQSTITVAILAVVAIAAAGGFIWSGIYDVGADDAHTRPVHSILQTLRERSIQARASQLEVPDDIADMARITQGAGNYDAMCTGCHLSPGMADTELRKGLYPVPPDLTREEVGVAEAFWVIKHGIKASGMPAWGRSMDDVYIWNMAAFLQQLPGMEAEQYRQMVAASGGHSHGGGETMPAGQDDHHKPGEPGGSDHPHPAGTPADHHGASPATPERGESAPAMIEHRHADGTVESHPAAQPATKADDGHDHQH